CDTVDIDNKPYNPNVVRSSYSHAQKMRACMTYTFGRIYRLGKQAWQERHLRLSDGDTTVLSSGNPLVSELVSCYMLSLHRRKVQKGDISTSARAIDIVSTTMVHSCPKSHPGTRLYDYNNKEGIRNHLQPYKASSRSQQHNIHLWGGPSAQRALHAIYTIAFFCLLRIDEVLKIRFNQIQFDGDKAILTLWYRKTHQYGGQ
ncbi:hypothetical protein BJ165DRAFT_1358231, partial [Panaeolus papilionaceus]